MFVVLGLFFSRQTCQDLGVRDYCLCLCTEMSTALISVMHLRLDLLHIIHTVISSHSSCVIRHLLAVNTILNVFPLEKSLF